MKLIKKVIEIGNGAAVYVPKEYTGKNVLVILPESIKNLKKEILISLIDFMPDIIGVYLYGSYAREEQTNDSDIDLLIITKQIDNELKKEIKRTLDNLGNLDVRIVPLNELKKSIENYPAIIMPILKEAETLVNPILLDEFKGSKINFRKFSWNFEDIKRIIKIIEGFIELDDNIPPSLIYSLIMRIRVCYILECLIKNKQFTNKNVEILLLNYGLNKREIDRFFYIYRQIREDEDVKEKIKKEDILKLVNILKIYSEKLEHETKKKIGKRN